MMDKPSEPSCWDGVGMFSTNGRPALPTLQDIAERATMKWAMMDALREKVGDAILGALPLLPNGSFYINGGQADDIAGNILAIPEIAEALALQASIVKVPTEVECEDQWKPVLGLDGRYISGFDGSELLEFRRADEVSRIFRLVDCNPYFNVAGLFWRHPTTVSKEPQA